MSLVFVTTFFFLFFLYWRGGGGGGGGGGRGGLLRHSAVQTDFEFEISGPLPIMLTSPCNLHPLTPHFYIVKLGFTGEYIFSYICSKILIVGTC